MRKRFLIKAEIYDLGKGATQPNYVGSSTQLMGNEFPYLDGTTIIAEIIKELKLYQILQGELDEKIEAEA